MISNRTFRWMLCIVVVGVSTGAIVEAVRGTAGAMGAPESPGPPWLNEKPAVYGDGSAGDLTVSVSGILGQSVASDYNWQFNDFTVETGVTLWVASGTVILCQGQFTNLGTIVVLTGDGGGTVNDGARSSPGQGVAHRPAGHGAVGDNTSPTIGGEPGQGLSEAEAHSLRHVGPGAGGGGGANGFFGAGGRGGGSLTVLAYGGISNSGTISANAAYSSGLISPGDGGGAGGVIILASPTSVTNGGTITALGSDGQDGGVLVGTRYAGGGGGGGGIVHFLSPALEAGSVKVEGGLGGNAAAFSPAFGSSAGGGGGACGGNGGLGGSVPAGTNPTDFGSPGAPGHFLQTAVDPTSLF